MTWPLRQIDDDVVVTQLEDILDALFEFLSGPSSNKRFLRRQQQSIRLDAFGVHERHGGEVAKRYHVW